MSWRWPSRLVPRIRTLKPEHKAHRKIGPLTDRQYRLWVGMITEADDEGRLVADPDQLRVLIFGYHHQVGTDKIAADLGRLSDLGLVHLYAVEGTPLASFPSWAEHQRIEHPSPSRLPSPEGHRTEYLQERSIHDDLYVRLCDGLRFAGHVLTLVERNVRLGSGFADLVLTTELGTRLVVELKKTRIDLGAIKQVVRYRNLVPGGVAVVIGRGVSPVLDLSSVQRECVALIAYSETGVCSLAYASDSIKTVSDVSVCPTSRVISHPVNAISQSKQSDLAPERDQGSRIKDQGSRIKEGIKDQGGERLTPPPPPQDGQDGNDPPPGNVTFRINDRILSALDRAPMLGRVPRLRDPLWWQAELRANPGVALADEVLKAEAWLRTNPNRAPRKDSARFFHNWLARADRRTE